MAGTQGEPPAIIRAAATIFVVMAWIAIVDAAFDLLQGQARFAFWLLGFWIAPGLRRADPTRRKWALALSAANVLGTVIGTVLVVARVPVKFEVFGVARPDVPAWAVLVMLMPIGVAGAWVWRTLRQPTARDWFGLEARPASPASEFPA